MMGSKILPSPSPLPKKKRGKGGGKGSPKAKAKAQAKRGALTGKPGRPGKLPCLCCEEAPAANSRFCKDHKRSCDAMSYQAKHSGEERAQEIFDELFADDSRIGPAVKEFSLQNPPTQKYKRKQLIDWVAFRRAYGVKMTQRDRSGDLPKAYKEFKIWCVNKKGLTDDQAKDWWKKLLDDPTVDRDNDGFGGAFRLWIPNAKQSRDRLRDSYIDNRQEEGSAVEKKPKPSDAQAWVLLQCLWEVALLQVASYLLRCDAASDSVAMSSSSNSDIVATHPPKPPHLQDLRDHVHRQEVSFGDAFFKQNGSGAGSSSSKRKEDQDDEAEAGVKRPVKKVCLERELPKFGTAMSKNIQSLVADMQKSVACAKKAAQSIDATSVQLTDKPSVLFKGTLHFRMQLAFRWLSDLNSVIVLGGGVAPQAQAAPLAAPTGPAPAAPQDTTSGAAAEADKDKDEEKKAGDEDETKEKEPDEHCAPKKNAGIIMERELSSPAQSEVSVSMMFGNAEPSALQEYKTKIRKQSTVELLKNNPHKKPFDASIDTFKTQAEMQKEMQRILDLNEAETFIAARESWNDTVNTVKEFIKNLARAATDMSAHIKSLETKAKSEREREEKEKQRQEVAKAREDAKKAADDVRQNMAKSAPRAKLFEINFEIAGVPKLATFRGNEFNDKEPNLPCRLIESDKLKLCYVLRTPGGDSALLLQEYLTNRTQCRIVSSITFGDKLHLWPSPQRLLSYACSSNDSDSRSTPGKIPKPSFGSRESLRCQFGMRTRGSALGMFGVKLLP